MLENELDARDDPFAVLLRIDSKHKERAATLLADARKADAIGTTANVERLQRPIAAHTDDRRIEEPSPRAQRIGLIEEQLPHSFGVNIRRGDVDLQIRRVVAMPVEVRNEADRLSRLDRRV